MSRPHKERVRAPTISISPTCNIAAMPGPRCSPSPKHTPESHTHGRTTCARWRPSVIARPHQVRAPRHRPPVWRRPIHLCLRHPRAAASHASRAAPVVRHTATQSSRAMGTLARPPPCEPRGIGHPPSGGSATLCPRHLRAAAPRASRAAKRPPPHRGPGQCL